MKLTAIEVGTLAPGEYAADDSGLVLRVRQSGARSWALRYSFRGIGRRFTIGKAKVKDGGKGLTLRQAKDEAVLVLARIAKGEDPQAVRVAERKRPDPEAMTVGLLGDKAMTHLRDRLKRKPKTLDEYQRLLDVEIRPVFGDLPATELTRRAVREWSEKLAKRAPYVANRAYQALRRFYSLGVKRDLIVASPFAGLERPAPEKASERVLSLDELWALRQALDGLQTTGSQVVRLLLLTGVRREMVLGARASEFEMDGTSPRWIVPGARTKNGLDHIVPLTKPVLQLLNSRPKGTFLFPAGRAHPERQARRKTKTWRSAYVGFLQKRMNTLLGKPAPRWTIHNLRHTIRTHMREHLHVPNDVAELIIGHKRAGVAGVYDRSELLKERRDALAKWATFLERLPAPGKKLLKWKEQA